MAVEKMTMINLIGRIDQLDRIAKDVIKLGSVHIVDAMEEMNTTDFAMEVSEENKEVLMELNYIRPSVSTRDYDEFNKKVEKVKLMYRGLPDGEKVQDEDLILDFDDLDIKIDQLVDKFEYIIAELNLKQEKKAEYSLALEHFKLLQGIDVPVELLFSMKNFSFTMLKVSSESMIKLNHNSENIPAMFIKLSKSAEYEYIGMVVPYDFKLEVDRILKSLNCEKVTLEHEYKGRPSELIEDIESRTEIMNGEIENLKRSLETVSKQSSKDIAIILKSVELENKFDTIKSKIAYSEDFFFLFGWLPENELSSFKNRMKSFESEITVISRSASETHQKTGPPTKLKNNFIFKPFETMVNMYGIPSYKEIDPTAFLALSYMGLFGAMFGDVGQGALLFIGGILLKYLKGMVNFGEITSRLGISSMLFGFFYGSIFGFETVISPLVIRPMENIMDILVYAVSFGLILLLVSFALNIVNSIKNRNLEAGLFGKDGLAGLLLYLSALVFSLSKYRDIQLMPGFLWGIVFVIPTAMILLKEPLVNMIKKKRPLFSGSKQDYFIEGGFGIVEIALSMFTNTLSFIRVGAFALTHVGLSLAFMILASMVQSKVGSAIIYIIGNALIIALEGLIVFIQGLRLEYYELFSKYYEGYGIAFEPVKLDSIKK